MSKGLKITRNAPCPCRSGRKFKHCHGKLSKDGRFPSKSLDASDLPPDLISAIKNMNAKVQRELSWPQVHGAILPSAHTSMGDGRRLASAGNALWLLEHDETWHGFLYDLLREQLGNDWFNAELSKSPEERHILARWYMEVCKLELDDNQRFTKWTPLQDTGATLAFRSVAYDTFCMMQAMSLTPKLLARLRHPDQFEGARYELWVAATLARADFSLELLNEDDRRSRHGELIATHRKSGSKFWVEAKRRHRQIDKVVGNAGAVQVDVQGLIADAVGKPANHARLIFIDVNLPPWHGTIENAPWVRQFRTSVNVLERQPLYRGRDDLRAYVMATNHPYHYNSNTIPDPRHHFIGTSFNMPDLDPRRLNEQHPVIMELMHSISRHFAIPDQFL
ncbi:YecA family protein [Caulobacter sp.]|uniref:YecA family protein n=1 Tax=Caulobacter sp. TaxID=78 RepID=UPI003BADAD83